MMEENLQQLKQLSENQKVQVETTPLTAQ